MREYATTLHFTKALKGSLANPFTALIYITSIPPDYIECIFTEIRLTDVKIIDGMETRLELQEPTSASTSTATSTSTSPSTAAVGTVGTGTVRTWIAGPYGWTMDEDGERGVEPWSFDWRRFVVKEVLDEDGGQVEAMALIALGTEGEGKGDGNENREGEGGTVVVTENWRD